MNNNIGTHNINRNINIYEYFTIKKMINYSIVNRNMNIFENDDKSYK